MAKKPKKTKRAAKTPLPFKKDDRVVYDPVADAAKIATVLAVAPVGEHYTNDVAVMLDFDVEPGEPAWVGARYCRPPADDEDTFHERMASGYYKARAKYPDRVTKPKQPDRDAAADAHRDYADALERYEIDHVAYRNAMDAYRESADARLQLFIADAFAHVGIDPEHPKADRLWHLAWEEGHSNGYSNVLHYLEEFATLVEDSADPRSLQSRDGLAIMDQVADILAERYDLDVNKVRDAIHAEGTQQLYDGFIARGIDRIAEKLKYDADTEKD